jgi:adenosylhomocysteine nucleosidase
MASNPRSLLGIVAALPAEARAAGAGAAPVGEVIRVADNVLLIRCGIGHARAGQAAAHLVQAGAGALLSWGTAAALEDHLGHGDLVLPDAVVSRQGHRFHVDPPWRARLAGMLASHGGCHAGTVAETESVLRGADDKRRLQNLSGALIGDMESAAIAEICQRAGIPLLVIRAVSDRVTTRIPPCALAAVDANGEVSVARCVGKLALAPADLLDLLRLARGFREACAALSNLAQCAGPDFQLSPPEATQAGYNGHA